MSIRWTRDKRVDVIDQTLRYPPDWPSKPAQEKSVDVLVALARAALDPQFDVVILASHDAALEPALEIAVGDGQARSRLPAGTANLCFGRAVRASGIPPSTQQTWT